MCGRYTLTADLDMLRDVFGLNTVPDMLPPRYNIAPSQPVAVITNEQPDELTFHKWGLVPSWSKDISIGNKMINARGETIAEKPSFRSAFKRRRCLIPADGFFEWRQKGGGKEPLFIHMNDRKVFAMAGLWEVWNSPEGDELRTCTIITTTPNSLMEPIHNRMPVILHPDDYAVWLAQDEQPSGLLQALIRPFEPDDMTFYPVSTFVNRPGNDTPECIEPIAS